MWTRSTGARQGTQWAAQAAIALTPLHAAVCHRDTRYKPAGAAGTTPATVAFPMADRKGRSRPRSRSSESLRRPKGRRRRETGTRSRGTDDALPVKHRGRPLIRAPAQAISEVRRGRVVYARGGLLYGFADPTFAPAVSAAGAKGGCAAGRRAVVQLDRVVLLSALHDIASDPETPEFCEVRRLRGFSHPTSNPTSRRPSPPARRTVTPA